jgi:hypothetical protein
MPVSILTIVLVFSVVGLGALLLSKFLNRNPMQAMSAARQQLIDQARSLQAGNVDHFFDEYGLASMDRAAGLAILQLFAKLLDVPVEKVAWNYDMRRLFVISKSESSAELHPFSTEIAEGLASISDKERWEQRWSNNPDLPRNEDALVSFIMGMSVPQVVQFFAPLVKQS